MPERASSQSTAPLDPVRNRYDMVRHFDDFITAQRNPNGTIGQLTSYQTEALEAGRDFLAQSDSGEVTDALRGRFDLACGYGKTALELYMARGVGAGKIQHNGSRRQVLLQTSRLSIIKQMTASNVQFGTTVGAPSEELKSDLTYFAPELRYSIYCGAHKDNSGDLVLMPYNSLATAIIRNDVTPETFALYLLDESHNLGTKRRHQLLRVAADAMVNGFSATPMSSAQTLPNRLKKVSMLDGILKHGFLSDTRMHATLTGQTIHKSRRSSVDYSSADISHLSHDLARNEQIVDIIVDAVSRHPRGMVRCHPSYKGFSHSREIWRLLANRGVTVTRNGVERPLRAEIVTGRSIASHAVIEEFRSTQNIDVLLAVSMLAEGVNVPSVGWGLWGPPTTSYDLLEQFIGRGNRRDATNPNKIFDFYQMVDTDISNPIATALAWEIVGAPRNAQEVSITPDKGVEHDGNTKGQKESLIAPPLIHQQRVELLTSLVLATDMADQEPIEKLVDLEELEEITGLEHIWLRRILFNEGYRMYIRSASDDFMLCYEDDALQFAHDAIARPDDRVVTEVAKSFGMDRQAFVVMLNDYAIPSADLYSREPPRASNMRRPHIRAADYARLLDRKAESEKEELPLYEAAQRARAPITALTLLKYFDDRGFPIAKQRTFTKGRPVYVSDRALLTKWIKEYQQAQPATPDYRALRSYSLLQYANGQPTNKQLHQAARICGAEVTICTNKRGARQDFVLSLYHPKMLDAIEELLKRAASGAEAKAEAEAQKRQQQLRTISSEMRLPLRWVKSFTHSYFGKEADTVEIDTVRERLVGVMGTLAIISDEPQLQQALGIRPRSDTQRRPAARKKAVVVERQPNIHDAPFMEVPPIMNASVRKLAEAYNQAPRLLRVLLRRHQDLARYHLDLHGREALEHLTHILGEYGRALPRVPESWVYSGDLAHQMRLRHAKFMELMVAKRINEGHLKFISIPGVRGAFAFCSPDLAMVLLSQISKDDPRYGYETGVVIADET